MPSDASAVCTETARSFTVNCSVTAPGSSTTSILNGSPTCSSLPELTTFLNPCRDTVMVYLPSGNASKLYWPEALVTILRTKPVPRCWADTSAPGTSAPDVSVTTPRIREVEVCAKSAEMV